MWIRDAVKKAISEAVGGQIEVELEHPEAEEHGDYSSNIALKLKGGRGLAQKIADFIKPNEVIAKVEVAGPVLSIYGSKKSILSKN